MMEIDEAIKHCKEVAERQERASGFWSKESRHYKSCIECSKKYQQIATWLRELKVFKSRKGEWLRMSDEPKDDRYKCSHCGNVVHYKDKMDLYTFNKWCGRCGSDNGRK